MTSHAPRADVHVETEDTPADLATFIGAALRSNIISQDCVNVAMIRHWVEAMGDDNPVHLDRRAAQATGRSGGVWLPTVTPPSSPPTRSSSSSKNSARVIASGLTRWLKTSRRNAGPGSVLAGSSRR
jgi:hypothetical protein